MSSVRVEEPTLRRIVLERGVALSRAGHDAWICESACEDAPPADAFSLIGPELKLRPVVIVHECSGRLHSALLDCCRGPHPRWDTERAWYDAMRLGSGVEAAHTARAVEFHCVDLALGYASVTSRHVRVWGDRAPGNRPVDYLAGRELGFRFEALVVAIWRCYNSLRRPLWARFGESGSMPASLPATLKQAGGIPQELAERVQVSLDRFGRRVKEYRDCIEHYVPVFFSDGALMERRDPGFWACSVFVADNPVVRSTGGFTWHGRVDALSWGWRAAVEVLQLANAIAAAASVPDRGTAYR